MTRALATALLLLQASACAGTPPSRSAEDCTTRRTGDCLSPGFLDGSWQLEMRVTSRELRYQPPSAPFPAANDVRGTVTFDMRALASRRDSILVPEVPFRGVIRAPLDSLLARTPPGWADGVVPFAHHSLGAPEGAFAVLVGSDSCADCGHIILRGTRQGDEVCGIWRQAFLGIGDRGTFILRRTAGR